MQPCASPEYFRGISPYSSDHTYHPPSPYRHSPAPPMHHYPPQHDGGYVIGVPLEPPPPTIPAPPSPRLVYEHPEDHDGPSTADIIANQSQDYVDEKLAEYQATIQQLQGKIFFSSILFYYLYAV